MFKNFVIFCISMAVSLLIAEGAMRLVFDPVDFLAAEIESDPVLNHRIGPGDAGHDDWGYRNSEVPEAASVLAIGDSMTYGIMAKSYESWPARLEDVLGQEVYSAALGGYGPLHYLHILKTRAPELNPDAVVMMVYLGNDIMDTYNLAYSNENWSQYRNSDSAETVDAALFTPSTKAESFTKRIRNWLAGRSVLYRLLTQNALFDSARQREMLQGAQDAIQHEHLGSPVVLDPAKRLTFTNVDDPRIQEGMRILKVALSEIAAYCAEQGIELHVSIMPVREQVFFNIEDGDLRDNPLLQKLDENLRTLQAELEAALTDASISYSDLLPVMENALRTAAVYPPTDGHPNAAGYAVVADYLAPIVTPLTVSN